MGRLPSSANSRFFFTMEGLLSYVRACDVYFRNKPEGQVARYGTYLHLNAKRLLVQLPLVLRGPVLDTIP
jgi:hypothetical protein